MLESCTRITDFSARVGHPSRFRQSVAILTAVALAGCAAAGGPPKLDTPRLRAAGWAAADEPRAVNAARDMLAQGGTLADAGAALALVLTVTLPSRASLGGGGACLLREGRELPDTSLLSANREPDVPKPTESYEFLPKAGRPDGQIGVPALARALYSIQAKYGKLRWEQVVSPAENMARFGVPVSRAFIKDIKVAGAEITGPDGKPLAEGDVLPQGALADTLAVLRARGAGDLYTGQLAARYLAGARGELDPTVLRQTAPVAAPAPGIPFGDHVAYFSATPGGALAQKLWQATKSEPINGPFLKRVVNAVAGERDAAPGVLRRAMVIADASAGLVPATGEPSAQGGDAATGFVVVDYRGGFMACSLTMGQLFGSGRIIGDTGIIASWPVPGPKSDGTSGAALAVVNENNRTFYAAFAGGGDRSGAQTLVETALNALAGPLTLSQAMTTPRVYAAGNGPLLVEPGLPVKQHESVEIPALGSINGVTCPGGLPLNNPQCSVEADPRGAGLTQTAERRR
jgi:gamma-glutamyltranspeptidase/glutathione hydrolase